MSEKFTLRPWRAETNSKTDPYYGVFTLGGDTICSRIGNAGNAKLIAAAPALYAAAVRALNYITNTEGELGITLDSGDALRAALAQARGDLVDPLEQVPQ